MNNTEGGEDSTRVDLLDTHSPERLAREQSTIDAAVPGDKTNPALISGYLGRPDSRHAGERRRHSSTFSTYYLNRRAKEIASLVSVDDRLGEEDFFATLVAGDIDLLLGGETKSKVTLPESKSRAVGIGGARDKETTATRAMFSFKSELQSLIGNLQETT